MLTMTTTMAMTRDVARKIYRISRGCPLNFVVIFALLGYHKHQLIHLGVEFETPPNGNADDNDTMTKKLTMIKMMTKLVTLMAKTVLY